MTLWTQYAGICVSFHTIPYIIYSPAVLSSSLQSSVHLLQCEQVGQKSRDGKGSLEKHKSLSLEERADQSPLSGAGYASVSGLFDLLWPRHLIKIWPAARFSQCTKLEGAVFPASLFCKLTRPQTDAAALINLSGSRCFCIHSHSRITAFCASVVTHKLIVHTVHAFKHLQVSGPQIEN